MFSKGFKIIAPIVVLAIVVTVGAGTAIYFRSPTEKILPSSDSVFDKQAENLNSAGEQSKNPGTGESRLPADMEELSQLEQQLTNALKSGGISPETYKIIDGQLKEFEKNGIDTSGARAILSKLEIGGAKKEVPKNAPLIPSGQSSRQSSAQTEVKVAEQSPVSQRPVCVSNLRPIFSNYLIDPALVTNILPPPNRPKTDLTVLKTHSYINTPSMDAPIYAPADMELIKGAHYVGGPYSLDFKVSCEVMLRLAHITNPAPKIKAAFPAEPQNGSADNQVNPHIAFKAGELVGYSGGPPYTLAIGFDFGVYNSATPNRFATEPEKYNSSIYTTAVCPFDYFTSAIREEYKAKFYLQTHEGMQYDLPHFCQ